MNEEQLETLKILVKEPDGTPLVLFVLAALGEECVELIGGDPSVSTQHWGDKNEDGQFIYRLLLWPMSFSPTETNEYLRRHRNDFRFPSCTGKHHKASLGCRGLEKLKQSFALTDSDYLCDFRLGRYDSFKVRASKLAPVLIQFRRAGVTEVDTRTLRLAYERAALC